MKRRQLSFAAGISLLLLGAVGVLWLRSGALSDHADWTYDRYLPDGSAASNQIRLTSDKRLWLEVSWGRVGPFDGQLVWGYYVNADQSGGRPRLWLHREAGAPAWITVDADADTTGFGPLRWQSYRRFDAAAGERYRLVRLGVSHWLAALLLLVAPLVWLIGCRKVRRPSKPGLRCGRTGRLRQAAVRGRLDGPQATAVG